MKKYIFASLIFSSSGLVSIAQADIINCRAIFEDGIGSMSLMPDKSQTSAVSPSGNYIVEFGNVLVSISDRNGTRVFSPSKEMMRDLRAGYIIEPLKGSKVEWSANEHLVSITPPVGRTYIIDLTNSKYVVSSRGARFFGESDLIITSEKVIPDMKLKAGFEILDSNLVRRKIVFTNNHNLELSNKPGQKFAYTSNFGKFAVNNLDNSRLQISNMTLLPNGNVSMNLASEINLNELLKVSPIDENAFLPKNPEEKWIGKKVGTLTVGEKIVSIDFVNSPNSQKIYALAEVRGDWFQLTPASGRFLSLRMELLEIDPASGQAQVIGQVYKNRISNGVRYSVPNNGAYSNIIAPRRSEGWPSLSPEKYFSFTITPSPSGQSLEVYGNSLSKTRTNLLGQSDDKISPATQTLLFRTNF